MATLVRSVHLPVRYWLLVAPAAVVASLLIGVPTAVIPNPLFTRMTPTRPLDYVFWIVSSILLGLLGATYVVWQQEQADGVQNKLAGGGFLSVLAVGCPICNKIVVFALGASGALRVRFQQLDGLCPMR